MSSLAFQIGDYVKKWFRYHFLERKLNSWFGYLFMAAWAVVFAYGLVFVNEKAAIASVIVVGFAVIAVASMLFPYFGYYATIIFSCLIFSPERLFHAPPLPLGIGLELMTYFTLL